MLDSSVRRAKIVSTLGPASDTPDLVRGLIERGLDVARLNFSHGDHSYHRKLYQTVREQALVSNKRVAILQDLQGPKLRAGALPKEGVELKSGDHVLLYPEGADPKLSKTGKILVPISAEIAGPVSRSVRKGASILFDDGKILTEAIEVREPEIVVEVKVGGKLTSHKGMNLPGTPLPIPCCTEKDLEDLKLGLSLGVDAVALSFVRSPADIEEVQATIRKHSNEKPLLFAKIERQEAVDCGDSIAEVADGILVARGDMAVEVGVHRVPEIQKNLIHSCNELGVPVITATQMLESMVSAPTPTRAEATDVANAVFDGTDALMLSGETASGAYPLEAVKMMSDIIIQAETVTDRYSRHPQNLPMPGSIVDSIEFSASRIAKHVGAVAIACITHSGRAARVLAKYRPETPIVAIMDNESHVRKLAFSWGVFGEVIPEIVSTDDLFKMIDRVLQEQGWAEKEDLAVVTAGIPSLKRGTTNMIKVHRVGVQAEHHPRASL